MKTKSIVFWVCHRHDRILVLSDIHQLGEEKYSELLYFLTYHLFSWQTNDFVLYLLNIDYTH